MEEFTDQVNLPVAIDEVLRQNAWLAKKLYKLEERIGELEEQVKGIEKLEADLNNFLQK